MALALALAASLAACNVYAPSWSAIHGDAGNLDYSWRPGPADVAFAWQRDFGGRIAVGATVDPQGRVYLTSDTPGCRLHALDPATGDTVWCTDAVDRFAVISAPLLDLDGRVFVADGRAMHAFDRDGTPLWTSPIEGVPLSAQFTRSGRLVFVTHIGRVYVKFRETGADLVAPLELIPGRTWDPAEGVLACATGTADCPVANTPAIDVEAGRLIFTFWAPGDPQASLRALQVHDDGGPTVSLSPLWTNASLPGGSASSPDLLPDGSRLYVNDNGGNLHAIDAVTGAGIWTHPVGFNPGGSPATSPEGLVMPAGGSGSPLLALADRGDHAEERWRRPDLTNRGIPTQAAGGRSYATVRTGSLTNDLVVVDTATGAELDRETIPGTSVFTVGTTLGPEGNVYVPSFFGRLSAFRPATPQAGSPS